MFQDRLKKTHTLSPGPSSRSYHRSLTDHALRGSWYFLLRTGEEIWYVLSIFPNHHLTRIGDVIRLHVLGRSIVVLNSAQAAVDLLDKRSSNYSDRSYFPIYEAMGHSKTLIFMKYGKDFQLQRRMFQQSFSKDICMSYHSVQSREARVLVQNLISQSDDREEQFLQ